MIRYIATKVRRKLHWAYRRFIIREKSLLELERWYKDKGDELLRLDYPLSSQSVVLDIGGYRGDFAAVALERFGCRVYLFEPVTEYYQYCKARFSKNDRVSCLDFGLSSQNGMLEISLLEDASSFVVKGDAATDRVKIRSITEVIGELGIEKIDLVKINIEGGEYDVLPALIESGYIEKVRFLQVQFHTFVPDAKRKRDAIREKLKLTHEENWNYEFVWESWSNRSLPTKSATSK